jgi:FkbM family methyltransferase
MTDRHATAVALHGEGRSQDAMELLIEESRERLGDAELLNDLGVLAQESGRTQVAEAVLRTALVIAPDDVVRTNVTALDELREQGFVRRLMEELIAWAEGPDRPGNFDPLHNPDGPPGPAGPRDEAIGWTMRNSHELEWLYRKWADDQSRDLMVRLFAFRILGARKVELPNGATRVHALIEQTRALRIQEASVPLGFQGWSADRYDLSPIGFPVIADLHPLNVIHEYLQQQYSCPAHEQARVRPGDTVVDGGACWGDTALYFATRVGPQGRVISYEFSPSNVKLLADNLSGNGEIGARVTVEHRALWDRSDELLAIEGSGPATQVGSGSAAADVPTRAIDDLPQTLGVERIDFIKLDIEGAELRALHGAEQTLRRDRPRLAIALYHGIADWTEIPAYIDSLGLGYRFSLGHFTIHHCETVLFAWCDQTA